MDCVSDDSLSEYYSCKTMTSTYVQPSCTLNMYNTMAPARKVDCHVFGMQQHTYLLAAAVVDTSESAMSGNDVIELKLKLLLCV